MIGHVGISVAFGLAVMTMIYAVGNVSGAHLNPARSIGPAIVSGQFTHVWVYIVAPVLGALLAAPGCRVFQGEDCCVPEAEATQT